MLVYTTAAFLLFAASAFADCSGFAGSCGPLYVKTGTSGADMVLYATRCSDEQGEFNYNPEIRINDCLANIYGDLKSGTECVLRYPPFPFPYPAVALLSPVGAKQARKRC